jgi:hypothetical protein
VGDTETTDQWFTRQRLFQLADLARAANALELAGITENRNACAVVAAVFQAFEAFEQNGGDISFSDRANNSTHVISPG